MKYCKLGASGLEVGRIGLGSWLTLGKALDQRAGGRLVHRAFERGVNLFDTADVYNLGEGEKALGEAVRDLPRHRLVLASKCFFPMSDDVNDRGLSRKHVHESIDGTLRRLGTDYLDLYQCHRFDETVPMLETARAMDDLIRRGKVLYWGVSMWPAERIAELVQLCRQEHLYAPISNQPLYNLFERDIETAVLPTCERLGLSQLVYSPLAQGVLTGKYGRDGSAPAGSRGADAGSNQFLGRYLTAPRLRQAQAFVELAQQHGLEPATLAVSWCLRDERVAAVLIGARSEAQLEQNLAAVDCALPPPLLQQIDRLFLG